MVLARTDVAARHDPLATVAITAEIPAIPLSEAGAGPAPVSRRRERRLPAPVLLRQTVWFLFVLALLGGLGLWGLHVRPSWFNVLRAQAGSSRPTGTLAVGKGGGTRPSTTSGSTTGAFHLLSSQRTGILTTYTYATGATSYTLSVATANRCWVEIKTPSDASAYSVEQTEPAGWHGSVAVSGGGAFVQVAASGSTITLQSGGRVIGRLAQARVADYIFQP